MAQKVLVIAGSPRNEGNTEFCMRHIFDRVSKAPEVQAQFVRLTDQHIKRCTGCRGCMEHMNCVIQDDDFPVLMDQMLESYVIVFGAPVFWNSPPGIAKDFIDRTHGYYAVYPRVLRGKKAYIVSVAGDTVPASHEDAMTCWLRSYQAEVCGLVQIIAREKGDMESDRGQWDKLDRVSDEIVETCRR